MENLKRCKNIFKKIVFSIVLLILISASQISLAASYSDSRFSLSDKLDIRVENQGITNSCWAF